MILIGILVVASGLFVLASEAIQAGKKPRMQINSPAKYIATARIWSLVLQALAAILAGYCMKDFTAPRFAAGAAALILSILLLGDIIPRIIARRAPEAIAAAFFPLLRFSIMPLEPFFSLAHIIARRLSPEFAAKAEQSGMTEEDLHDALVEGEKSGIVESKERTMVEGVFYLGDRPLGAFMAHRSEIQWLDINVPLHEIRANAMEHREQRCFPVVDGSLDSIIGAAYLEDIILDLASESPAGLRAIMKDPLFAPETMPALKAFESFKRGEANFLFVMDEYGGFAGMVSMRTLMEEIVGELALPKQEEAPAVQTEDGTWLVDGGLNIDDAAELLSLPGLSGSGDYHTLAGFVLSLAGEIPQTGDSFMHHGCRFTVLDKDGNRIDKIGVKREGAEN